MPDCIRSAQEVVSAGVRFTAATQNIDSDESGPLSRFLCTSLRSLPSWSGR